jgi:hypothetical protein
LINFARHLDRLPGDDRPNPGVVWLAGYEVIRAARTQGSTLECLQARSSLAR